MIANIKMKIIIIIPTWLHILCSVFRFHKILKFINTKWIFLRHFNIVADLSHLKHEHFPPFVFTCDGVKILCVKFVCWWSDIILIKLWSCIDVVDLGWIFLVPVSCLCSSTYHVSCRNWYINLDSVQQLTIVFNTRLINNR